MPEAPGGFNTLHIPDGYLGPITYGGLWALQSPIWYYCARRLRKTMSSSEASLLALASAFSFVIMMFNVPAIGGTTGHATGATLIAVLLGPWASVLSMSIALAIQAVLFGDGGITTFGANCFNIAFAEAVSGFLIYKVLTRGEVISKRRRLFAVAAGSYAGLNIAALLTAFELGIQSTLHVGPDGRPLYSPFPLKLTVPAIMLEHLTLFGFVEASVSAVSLAYIMKSHPELVKGNEYKT